MANAGNYTDATDTDFTEENYNIDIGKSLSANGMRNALHTKEKVANKQIHSTDTAGTLTASSSDSYYPTSKLVGANLDEKENTSNKKDAIDDTTKISDVYYPTTSAVNNAITTAISAKQDNIAGTAGNIVTYSGTAGTLGSLTKATSVSVVASAVDTALPTEKAVASAISTATSTLNTALGNKQNILPVGTILMYDGTNWQDNVTLVGWYTCDATNKSKGLTPDLSDRFIVGVGNTAKRDTANGTKGSNALTAAMLPKHTHSIYTNATKNTARTADKSLTGAWAVDTFSRPGVLNADGTGTYAAVKDGESGGIITDTAQKAGDRSGDGKGGARWFTIDATHEHTGSANSNNSSTGDSNTSNMPAYYAVIYIKRCA